ncbi:MAG TPA: hypothetical protein VK498_00455 [Ferruginibacter sp.]|nr:hypothetical protein [Ferruginibacter sp.]
MQLYRMRCLLLSSCLLFFIGCAPAFKPLQAPPVDGSALKKFKPAFKVALYNTKVDVIGNHLSGLLLIKKMPDSSTRFVFSNEMGFTFFDFGFSRGGDFRVYSIINKMNKRAVVKTLRKDFELILMNSVEYPASTRKVNGLLYYVYPQSKGYNYYITDSTSQKLVRLERASKSKTVVEVIMKDYINGIPDTIGISHKTFAFTIGLKRIVR